MQRSFRRLVLTVLFLLLGSAASYALESEVLKIVSGHNNHEFEVEIARNSEEQMKGLMGRSYLEDNKGMIFLYDKPQHINMWMKNTKISLDMLFIREDGVIVRISQKAEPYSLRSIPSGEPVIAVLELNGGISQRLGIKPGDKIEFSSFSLQK